MQQEQRKPDRPTKPETVHSKQLEWSPYEAGEPGEEAVGTVVHGYELVVNRVLDDEQEPTRNWNWMVRTTSELSETPELIDMGEARSLSGAQIAAKEALNRERRSAYQQARAAYDKAEKAKSAKPKPKQTPKRAPKPIVEQETPVVKPKVTAS